MRPPGPAVHLQQLFIPWGRALSQSQWNPTLKSFQGMWGPDGVQQRVTMDARLWKVFWEWGGGYQFFLWGGAFIWQGIDALWNLLEHCEPHPTVLQPSSRQKVLSGCELPSRPSEGFPVDSILIASPERWHSNLLFRSWRAPASAQASGISFPWVFPPLHPPTPTCFLVILLHVPPQPPSHLENTVCAWFISLFTPVLSMVLYIWLVLNKYIGKC